MSEITSKDKRKPMAEFANIKKEDCVKKSLPKGAKLNASHTLVLQSVINAIKAHGRSSMNKEVCGVLVGNLCWDKKPFLLIDARIEGKFADHQAGSVTFTSETWDYIHSELSEKYPKKQIVGWYHTHPGFGIFLSNMDFFIHENFFSPRWQPAYVFDPQAETEGFFFWNKDNLSQETVPVILDEPPVNVEATGKKGNGKISVVLTEEDELAENKKRLRTGLICVLIALLVIDILVIYMLCGAIKENKLQGEEIYRLKKNNKEQSENLFKGIEILQNQLNAKEESDSVVIAGLRKEIAGVLAQCESVAQKLGSTNNNLTIIQKHIKVKEDSDSVVIAELRKEIAGVLAQCEAVAQNLGSANNNLTNLQNQIKANKESDSIVIAELRKGIAGVLAQYESVAQNLGSTNNNLTNLQNQIRVIGDKQKAFEEAKLAEEERMAEERRMAEEKRIAEEKHLEEAQMNSKRWYQYLGF